MNAGYVVDYLVYVYLESFGMLTDGYRRLICENDEACVDRMSRDDPA